MSEKKSVRDWWTNNPMTYGDTHGKTEYEGNQEKPGSRAFFEHLDQIFYRWNRPLHGERPFSRLFPYEAYGPNAKILEIGCGLGTMSMLWAQNGNNITSVDLNPTSITQTKHRFEQLGLSGDIHEEDANQLSFQENTFDYAYSWGVLHHSPQLERSIAEMMRVIRPGGGFGIMLYHRNSFLHNYMTRYIEGFLHYENRFLGPLELASRYGDGAREEGNPHTWPVTRSELQALLTPYSTDLKIQTLGTELDDIFRWLLPGLGLVLPRWSKKVWARRWGWSLWIYGHKS